MGAYQHVKSPVTGDCCVIHMNCLYFHVFSRVFSHSAKTVFVTSMASPLRLSSGGHALQSLPKESWVNHESGAHQQLVEAALGFITQPSSHRNWKTSERHLENGWTSDPPLSNSSHPKRISDGSRLSPWASIRRFSCEGPVDVDRFFPRSYVARNVRDLKGFSPQFEPYFNAILTKGTLRYDKSMWWKWSIIDVIFWGKGHIHANTQTYADTCAHTHTL